MPTFGQPSAGASLRLPESGSELRPVERLSGNQRVFSSELEVEREPGWVSLGGSVALLALIWFNSARFVSAAR